VTRVLDRFGAGTVDLLRRVVFKTVTGPRRYGTEGGYDAQRFWGDRFRKYGTGLRGSGDEGLSESQNQLAYEQAGGVVLDALERNGVDLSSASVLDVGCGPGFFTDLLHSAGVESYTGVDITDQLFGDLQARFPGYRFEQKDVTSGRLEAAYDVVMMIDVAEHIVSTEAFDRCIANLAGAVAPGGLLLVGPLLDRGTRHLFYVRFWSTKDVLDRVPGFEHLEDVPFRNGTLTALRRPAPTPA
jgi:2-polyprenyl-3-methyl-5-hydroxy-6-metoxy-1,4-benzoquinol methylase